MEFNTETLKPTYKLLIGIPGLSNAIAISANLGLEKDIVDKAKNIIVSQKDPSIIVVEKLQETQAKLTQNLEETEKIKEESEILKSEYEQNLQTIKKDKKKTVKHIKEKFSHEILNAKDEIKEILTELRREKSEKIARRSYARLAQMERDFNDELSQFDEKQEYEQIDWDKIKINDKVILKELHQVVEILSLPDKNKNVFVQMGNFKTKIACDKLAPYDKIYEQKDKIYRPNNLKNFELKKASFSNTLDLRGYKVEDALDSLELYLDKASLSNVSPVYIIHGHGTGALKAAVREFLSTSPYVSAYRPGEDGEGGDGVSVIEIK